MQETDSNNQKKNQLACAYRSGLSSVEREVHHFLMNQLLNLLNNAQNKFLDAVRTN